MKSLTETIKKLREIKTLYGEILDVKEKILSVGEDDRARDAVMAAIDFKTKSGIHYITWEVYDHLVDSYFEKKQPLKLSTEEKIQILAQGNVELQEKVEAIDKDLQEFKRDLPLLGVECQKITYAKNQKVVPLLDGKDAPAYKNRSIRQKVYTDIDNQLRREFGVNTYKAIKRSQTDLAISIIKEYDLPMVLKNEIDAENAQECLW